MEERLTKLIEQLPQNPALSYLWVIFLAAWGGIAGYINKVKIGHTRFQISELVGDIVISAFVGIVTSFLCSSANINEMVTSAMVAISGHMGSRGIYLLENLLQKRLEKLMK